MKRTETGIETTCTICGTTIPIDFGELNRKQATEAIARLDGPRECPGFHVELSGFRKWWQLDEAVEFYFSEEK